MNAARMLAAAAALTAAATALGGDAGEPEIYAVNHQGNYPDAVDTIVRFSPDAPSDFETIGPLGVENTGFGGLAFDGDGNLWAYASFNEFGGASSGLYSVDLDTGAATVQGEIDDQTLNDIAWNPADETMYGVVSQGLISGQLHSIDLETGDVTFVGEFSGFVDDDHNLVGVGIDSAGTIFLYDNKNNKVYVSDDELNLTLLYDESMTQCAGCNLPVGSQGICIDWSRDDTAYHGAIGQGDFPNYYNNLNTFEHDGSAYIWGPSFGNYPDGIPMVQPGDITVKPAPPTPPCPADLDGDGAIGSGDLNAVLGFFGCTGGGCEGDVDGNGATDSIDLNLVLESFGEDCPE